MQNLKPVLWIGFNAQNQLTGFLQQPIPYSSMTEVYAVARWDPTYKYCLRIVLTDGSFLLQASNAYTRDQWYHSILWKVGLFNIIIE
ncbi:hypothetical protein PV325_012063 [Microctonus aethiopoides]|nr:hypothetical protein PV325_012063 [Microctonus aethiopoides]